MSSSKRISRRTFLLALAGGAGTTAVAAATVGRSYLQRFWRMLTAPPPPPPLQVITLTDLDESRPIEVCIIGSGPAGAILGRDLVEKGVDTVILEAGPYLNNPAPNINVAMLEAYRNSGDIQYLLPATRMRAVGGTSNLWTGRSPRLHPIDFEPNAYTPDGAQWPIDYEELAPYYERGEQTLRISGGKLSQFHPPRTNDLPFNQEPDISALKTLMATVDITVDETPTSIGLVNETQAIRISSDVLPFFTASDHGTLVSGAVVTQLLVDSSGHIEGVEVHDFNGNVRTLRANTYVIACGAIESARLLLLSRSDTFPQGIGNNSDLVGRFFTEHPNIILRGQLPPDKIPPRWALGRSHQFYESFKTQGFGSIVLRFIIDPQGIIQAGARLELFPVADNRVTLAPDLKDSFGNPGVDLSFTYTPQDIATFEAAYELVRRIMTDLGVTNIEEEREAWAHHHTGTCRMGDDPATSVVDANLRVHGTTNLYVVGSAVFVTAGASNPTLTIAALTHRLSDYLA